MLCSLESSQTRRNHNGLKSLNFLFEASSEVLRYVELPKPAPAQGEILIETTAIGVNFPDIRERMGVYNQKETRVGGVELPHVTGLQVVGHVVAAGDGVDRAMIGRKVMALMKNGAYAQFSLASAATTVNLLPDADDVAMASLPCQGATAYLTLQALAQLRPGESVLVHGAAGGVGSLAVQIAKALGAGTVIGTASSEERRAFVRGIGADLAIGYDDPSWPRTVLDHTQGRGVDVILESIGGDVFEQNFECLATFGRHIVFGSTRGPGNPLAPRRLMTKAQSLTGFYLPVVFETPELISRALTFLANGVADGSIKSNVAEVLPLSRAADAHRMLESRQLQGVIILDPAR
jgi:NADPH2:quinone reductase